MAVTKIWDIKGRLDGVLRYVSNTEKTVADCLTETEIAQLTPDEQALYDVMDYAMNDSKTEQKLYVTGIHCRPDNARSVMINTKRRNGKEDGIIAFHGYQSFKPGEVTPETAHSIGVKFANEMWGDKYEVIVATHLNTGCIHNHFCVNSVSFVDGSKYHDCKEAYARMREISDRLCREHGLSVIEKPKGRGLPYEDYVSCKKEEISVSDLIRRDIDECIAEAYTRKMFYEQMEARGYTFDFSHKYATIKHIDFERPRRLKTLGSLYTVGAIEDRIDNNWTPEQKKENIENTDKLFRQEYPDVSYPRFQYVFVRYTWELRYAKKHPWYNNRYLYLVKDDIEKLDRFSEEQELIIANDIKSTADLESLIEDRNEKVDRLIAARQQLRNKLKTAVANNDETAIRELKDRISDYSEILKSTRKEIRTAQRVKEDVENVASKTEKIEQRNNVIEQHNNRKREVKNYEHGR